MTNAKSNLGLVLGLILASTLTLISCARIAHNLEEKPAPPQKVEPTPDPDPVDPAQPANSVVTVLTYNVENLFDTLKDPGKDDYTNLPKALKDADPEMRAGCQKMSTDAYIQECLELDWSPVVLKEKLRRLKETILAIGGNGPDILILQEVENINVLKQLQKVLGKAKYPTAVLIEGDDPRGIDVAVLSKLQLAGTPELHRIQFSTAKGARFPHTRGILETPLRLPNGEKITIFGFHFPSQAQPVQQRIDAVTFLNSLLASKAKGELVLAAGDSNITKQENQNLGLQSKILGSAWDVSHLVGCQTCAGTFGANFFDIILFNKSLSEKGNGSFSGKYSSIKIVKNGKYQTSGTGNSPVKFDTKKAYGVSDHFPMYTEIITRSRKSKN